MNTTGGALAFDALIANTDFLRQINEMERRIIGMSNTAVRESDKIDQTFKRLGQLAAGYFSFNALSQLPAEIVKVRGEFQQLEIAFTTMLRSKAGADKLMGQLIETAATTPFGLKDIAAGAKQLLAYGSTAGGVVKEIRMLGDVASGVSVPIGDLIYLYGTLKTQGRAYAMDIRQFAGRGIPIYQELANVLKVNVEKVQELVTAGKVGFPQVEQAFKNMTTGGGMFTGLMDAQSKSLLGLVERFKDAWANMLNDIGKNSQDELGGAISMATSLVEHYQPVLDVLKVLVITYGAYRAAIIATSVVQSAAAVAGNVQAWFQLAATIRSAKDAQIAFNLATSANPYAVAAALLIGLVTALALYNRELSAAETAQHTLNDVRNKANEGASAEIAKIEALKVAITNENLSQDQRTKKLNELIALSPSHLKALTLENIKTGEGTQAIDGYINSLKRKLELQAIEKELTDSISRQQQAKDSKTELPLMERVKLAGSRMSQAAFTGIPNDARKEYAAQDAAALKRINGEIINNETVVQNKLKERIKSLSEVTDAATDGEGKTQNAVVKTVEYYNDAIKKLKADQEQTSTTRAEFLKYQTQIDAMEKSRNRLTGQKTAEEKKADKAAQKESDKTGPYGSVKYWDYVAQKAQEVIDKTPESDKGTIARQNAIRLDAERKAAAIRKTLEKKTFDEELEDKKKQYQLYEKWVEFVDRNSADSRFADLKKDGDTYVDYLNKQIATLEARRDEGTISTDDADNLVKLTVQRDEATGKKSAIDVFRDGLTKAKDEAKSLTDYLEELKEKQESLSGNNTDYGVDARKLVAEAVVEAERERKAQLQQFVESVTGSEQQRLAIQKKYSDLRTALDKQANGQRTADYQKTLDAINKAEKEETDTVKQQTAETSQAFKNLNKVIDAQGREALKIRLKRLQDYLLELEKTVGKESQLYQQTAKDIKDTGLELDKDTIDSYKTFVGLAGELGDALSDVNGGLGQTGRLLSGIAAQAGLVTVAFDKTASTEDKVAAGVQGVIGLIAILATSASQRRQAEEEYYRSMTAQQQAYNIALNNQLGLQSELNESVFVKDFDGRLKDGVAKLNAANRGYQDAIAKLSNGQAKSGQRNAVDWNNVGKGIGSGAAAGAAIGSVVPVIGTAIGAIGGAIIGGIAGLFGGKKKESEFTNLLKEYPELVKKGADGWEDLDESLAQTLIDQNLVDDNTKQLLQNTLEWSKQIDDARKQIKDVISQLAGALGDNLRDGLVGAFKDGTDAAEAFGKSVGEILENLLTQMLFSRVMGPALKQLEDEMMASTNGGDGNWVDDFGRFFSQSKALSTQFEQGLQDAKDAAKAYGIDILGGTKTDTAKPDTSLTGAVKSVTEETASLLAGQINAIRISQAEGLGVIRQQLLSLTEIAANTRYLMSIDNELKTLNGKDPLRAKGL